MDIRIITEKHILPSLETVNALLGAKHKDTAHEETRLLFQQLLPDVRMRMRPQAAFTIGELSLPKAEAKQTVLCGMLTVGDGIGRLAKRAEADGELLKAFVLDAMADSCLFALEKQLLPKAKQICMEEGYGIARRLEFAPDIFASVQKDIFEILKAERTLGITMTSGFMLKPEKSMSLALELTPDRSMQNLSHPCKTCSAIDCSLRKQTNLQLTVELPYSRLDQTNGTCAAKQISCKKGSGLYDVLQENGIILPAYCGQNGTCGKCGVLVKDGLPPPTPEDYGFFSESELRDGMRLSCKAILQSDCTIQVLRQEECVFQVPGHTPFKYARHKEEDNSRYGIAVDIGTTTLAFALVRLSDGSVERTHTAANSQRSFGSDVLTRMQAANTGKAAQLCRCIKKDIQKGIQALIGEHAKKAAQVFELVIAANTAMMHLLRGYSCESLSRHPFTPVSLELEEFPLSELFSDFPKDALQPFLTEQIQTTLLPGISAFVGSDITAGLYACSLLNDTGNTLFLDLGTNGEMALKKEADIYTASAAAGPAFEAATIQWGMPGIAGAISQVKIRHGIPEIKTIAGRPPLGICGTGVIEAIAQLYTQGYITSDGMLREPYFSSGYPLAKTEQGRQIVLLQQDIREIQMAKAAIRTGIEILLLHSGTQYQEISQVYLAGGFGYFLDVRQASAIGILPKELVAKTKAVGNTALEGACSYLKYKKKDALLEIIKKARGIPLAQDAQFQELYMRYLSF